MIDFFSTVSFLQLRKPSQTIEFLKESKFKSTFLFYFLFK
jgi:hypothetical protein